MSLSTAITSLAQSLRDDLYGYAIDNRLQEVLVETYRLDSQVMENTNMKGIRIAIYDGGDSVASAIPGYAQQRGDRVQWGAPYATEQTIIFDIAFFIGERDMYGWN